MSLETAKKMLDMLLTGEKGMKEYINPQKSPGLIIDFIGGEPLLEAKLIDQICSYAIDRMIELNHPWLDKTMFSICSNGTLYHDPEVGRVLNKWKNRLSFSVTVDGNKELHDSCRIFPDGSPSYDLAVSAAKDWMNKGNYMGSKITIAPANVMHTYDAIVHISVFALHGKLSGKSTGTLFNRRRRSWNLPDGMRQMPRRAFEKN